MRLESISIHGYKRFASESILYVRSPLVALVGPNEAGKTSLLRGIAHLSHEESFDRREYTDRKTPAPRGDEDNPIIVSARFSLDKADANVVGDLLPDWKAATFTLGKRADGEITWVLSTKATRDTKPRQDFLEKTEKALRSKWLPATEQLREASALEAGEEFMPTVERLGALADELRDAPETLPMQTLDEADQLTHLLEGAENPPSDEKATEYATAIREFIEAETAPHPRDDAGAKLLARRPPFLFFDRQDERWLEEEYRWEDYPQPSPALDNLCSIAGISYQELRAIAMDPERSEELHTINNTANRNLESRFATWTQSRLSVVFWPDGERLRLQIRDRETDRHTRLAERSDGLRWFVALVAFTARHADDSRSRPVLLIDEAEIHLHYGAQADLIKVLATQDAAQTVIYSTHSIGCLPEDLGTSIRVVEPTGHERSEVRHSVWSGGAGLTPLVLALGANALAFTPSRFAVIGEGSSEAMLLPTLIREGHPPRQRSDPLGYQVAPGVAEVDEAAAVDLELEAGNVVYLVDGDPGGHGHIRKLPDRARREGRVLSLADVEGDAECLEDFIASQVLLGSINKVGSRTRPGAWANMDPQDLPAVGRSRALHDHCESHRIKPLSKGLVADAVLEQFWLGKRIVEGGREAELRALHKLLRAAVRKTS